jgi:hypothetical protein
MVLLVAALAGVILGGLTRPRASATAASAARHASDRINAGQAELPGSARGTAATLTDARAELDADGQNGDGRQVRIEKAALSTGSGHVAVFTRNGQLLGSAPVASGVRPVVMTLTVPAATTGELQAVLYGDDGDGAFDAAVDPRVVDEDGKPEEDDFDYRLVGSTTPVR